MQWCGTKWKGSQALAEHKELAHPVCRICRGAPFPTVVALEAHVSTAHPLGCEPCAKDFISAAAKRGHDIAVHFQCEVRARTHVPEHTGCTQLPIACSFVQADAEYPKPKPVGSTCSDCALLVFQDSLRLPHG